MRTREAGFILKPPALKPEFSIQVVVIIKMCSFCLGSECCIKRGSQAKIEFSHHLKEVTDTRASA
jgi:hypothetical protein